MIEAIVGGGYRGDIAIDDVSMTSGACSAGRNNKLELSDLFVNTETCKQRLALIYILPAYNMCCLTREQ